MLPHVHAPPFLFQKHHWSDRRGFEGIQHDVQVSGSGIVTDLLPYPVRKRHIFTYTCPFAGTSTRRSLGVSTTRSSNRVYGPWATTCPWWKKANPILSLRPYSTRWTPTGLSHVEALTEISAVLLHTCVYIYTLSNRGIRSCRDGNVSLQEYMAFMISRETENVKSSEEIESAFRALSTENKPYVTKEELYQVRNVPSRSGNVTASVKFSQRFNSPPSPLSFSESDQGAGGLLPLSHEALPRQQGPRAAVSFRLCRIHPLALCQLIPRPPVTNREAFPPPNTHTHFHKNTRLKLHDCGTRITH